MEKKVFDITGVPGKVFVRDFTRFVYSWADRIEGDIEYQAFKDVLLPDDYKFDYLVFVFPGWKTLGHRQTYTIGIKMISNCDELSGAISVPQYTDFFVIGTFSDIVGQVLEAVDGNMKVGVMGISDGQIFKYPKRNLVPADQIINILQKVVYAVVKETKTIILKMEDKIPSPLGTPIPELPDVKFQNLPENLSTIDRRVLAVIKTGVVYANSKGIQDLLNKSSATINRSIGRLVDMGLIRREGSKKSGYYIVV